MNSPEIPIAELGYEAARDELTQVVKLLELGKLDLDASLSLWERGEALAKRCEQHLDGAQRRIEAVLSGQSGADQPHGTAAARGTANSTGGGSAEDLDDGDAGDDDLDEDLED